MKKIKNRTEGPINAVLMNRIFKMTDFTTLMKLVRKKRKVRISSCGIWRCVADLACIIGNSRSKHGTCPK